MDVNRYRRMRQVTAGANGVVSPAEGQFSEISEDAPALAAADVGIAIGIDTDVVIATGDITLILSNLMDLLVALEISKATIANIRHNLIFAFGYNTIGIAIATGVFFPVLDGCSVRSLPVGAAMALSSVSVVSNGLRLKRFRPHLQYC